MKPDLDVADLEALVADPATFPPARKAALHALQHAHQQPRLVRRCALCRQPATEDELLVEHGLFRHRSLCPPPEAA